MNRVTTIMLVGGWSRRQTDEAPGRDAAFWQVGWGASRRVLEGLARQGVSGVWVCGRAEEQALRGAVGKVEGLDWSYVRQERPAGTGGSLREVMRGRGDGLVLVLPGNSLVCPDVEDLLERHEMAGADVTVLLAGAAGGAAGETPCAYLCKGEVLAEMVNGEAYTDLKESLLPRLAERGRRVRAVRADLPVVSRPDWREYLEAVCWYLVRTGSTDSHTAEAGNGIHVSPSARIAANARLIGPVRIMEDAQIDADALVIGPVVLERGAKIGAGSLVSRSVLWPGAIVGRSCQVRNCLIVENARVADGCTCEDMLATDAENREKGRFRPARNCENRRDGMTKMCQCPAPRKAGPVSEATGPHLSRLLIAGLAVMAGVGLLWAHLPALRDLWTIWLRSDEYSSGLLVPPLAAYLIWSRRLELASCPIRPVGWGIFAVLAAEAFGVFGFLFMFGSAMRLSFVLAVIACFFTLFGWPIFRKVWPVLLFLFLMLPLPNRVEGVITMPLQGWSTASAVFGLETLGYEAVREGNVIHIGETSVAVAEACNGLRMVTGFIVICALVVLLVKRPAWQKVVLLASALPIALACNTVRLILTSLAFTLTSNPSWRDALHDYGGYAMMPLALASVWGELYLMHLLVVAPNDAPEQQKEDILVVGRCAQNCQAE